MKKLSLAELMVVLMLTPAVWGAHDKPADSSTSKLVDSGTFGIFKSGHRVATESFTVQQGPEMSVISSQIKTEDASMSESSELQLAPNGDLRRYLWKELTPGKSQLVLEPGEQILTEHISLSGTEKAHDVPFVLPISTMVLDDYFFVHREVLTWKYIATSCVPQPTAKGECLLVKSSLGVIIPRQQTSGSVAMEYKGMEKVMIRGAEKQLRRFSLRSEDQDWALWLNDDNKLVKISIPGDETEVVRD